MFITLKSQSRKSRAKGEMEQVTTKDASTGNVVSQTHSTKRRPACVACQRRKLRCTGSFACCDRCKSRAITCICAKKSPGPPSSGTIHKAQSASTNESEVDPTMGFSPNLPAPVMSDSSYLPAGEALPPFSMPGDPASFEAMQQIMGGIDYQNLVTPPPTTTPSTTGSSSSCSCTQNVVQVLSNIEEDQFKLTRLSLDQVVQLQKWLMYQCCTALECPRCHGEKSVHTLLVLICERILLMYECAAARMAKTAQVQATNHTGANLTKGTDDYANYYPPNKPAQLFCGISGVPVETANCQGGICSPEQGSQYTIEEQVCMVHALMKMHMKSFRGLLDWIGGTCEESGNMARTGKIEALGTRLVEAGEQIDASAGMIMNRFEMT